jgi:hypothetical protein
MEYPIVVPVGRELVTVHGSGQPFSEHGGGKLFSDNGDGQLVLNHGDSKCVPNGGSTIPATDRMLVRLCFYEPRGSGENWLNRLVAWFGKYYVCHVEILFADDMAASIFADEVVFWRKRSYSNPQYKIHSFDVSKKSYWLMYNHASGMAARNVGFSNAKMFCGPLIGFRGSSDLTFCSEFVTQTLQVGGVEFAMKMNAGRSTPSSLLHFMNTHSNVCFDSTAFKLGQAFG